MNDFLMRHLRPWSLMVLILILLAVGLILCPGSGSSPIDCPRGMFAMGVDAQGVPLGCDAFSAPVENINCPPGMVVTWLDARGAVLGCAPIEPLLPTNRETPLNGPDGS